MDGSPYSKDESEFRRNLAFMRNSGTFCDATICIPNENKRLPVHRAIMSSCSEFFRSLFTNGLQETLQHDVNIHGVSSGTMDVIIDYAYTKEVTITNRNAEEVFAAADRFNVLGLLQLCIHFFAKEISPDNCLGFLRFAKYYNNKELFDVCWKYIILHFKDIVRMSHEFLQLDSSELGEIVANDKLGVTLEDDVYEAVAKWVDHSPRRRKDGSKLLFEHVRFPYVSECCFEEKIINRRDLKRSLSWETISTSFDLVKKFRSRDDPKMKPQTHEITRISKPRVPSSVIFVLGGWSRDGVTRCVETYDRNADQWFQVEECALPQPRAYHSTVTLHDDLYAVGGFNGVHYLNSVVCFSSAKKRWEERAPMYMSRCYVSAVEMNGFIYACGGYDGRQRHSSAERYDRQKNQWSMIKPMFHQRSDAGATNHKGRMFVAGGFDGHSCLFTVEMYDPKCDQWTILSPMSTRRSGVSLISCEDRVYAIGGYDGARRLDSVEYYEPPKTHWYPSESMILGRSNFSSVVMDGVIYVMGGYDGMKTTEEVECYYPEKKSWFALNDMNLGRSAVSACAIHELNNSEDFTFHGNAYFDQEVEKNLKTPIKTQNDIEFSHIFSSGGRPSNNGALQV